MGYHNLRVLGKSGLVFFKLTNIIIHMNSTQWKYPAKLWYKIMTAKAENKSK